MSFEDLKESKKADNLTAKLGRKILWDDVAGEWYQFDGKCWMQIPARSALKKIKDELDECLTDGHGMNLLRNMASYLQINLAIHAWIEDRNLLPVANGILDLTTMKLEPHDPSYLFRWKLPYDYDKKAKCRTVMGWLKQTTGNDAEIIEALRAALFFSIVGAEEAQKFMEIVGPGGSGKSTFVRMASAFIGVGNHVTTDLKQLETNRFETASLNGVRIAFINDSSRYGGEVSVLKAATGGDPLRIEKKNQQQQGGISFIARCFIFIVSNDPIQSTDYSSGLSRRRVPVTFTQQIQDEDKAKWRDVGGIETAMKKELPGMLNWVLSIGEIGALTALGGINGRMTKGQLEHLVKTNKLANWLDDNCVFIESKLTYTGSITLGLTPGEADFDADSKLYPNYHRWCKEHGHHPMAVQKFGDCLDDLLKSTLRSPVKRLKRGNHGRAFEGVAIRNTNHDDIHTPVLNDLLVTKE